MARVEVEERKQEHERKNRKNRRNNKNKLTCFFIKRLKKNYGSKTGEFDRRERTKRKKGKEERTSFLLIIDKQKQQKGNINKK